MHTTENDYNRDVLLEHKDEQTVDIPFTDPDDSCIMNNKAFNIGRKETGQCSRHAVLTGRGQRIFATFFEKFLFPCPNLSTSSVIEYRLKNWRDSLCNQETDTTQKQNKNHRKEMRR